MIVIKESCPCDIYEQVARQGIDLRDRFLLKGDQYAASVATLAAHSHQRLEQMRGIVIGGGDVDQDEYVQTLGDVVRLSHQLFQLTFHH